MTKLQAILAKNEDEFEPYANEDPEPEPDLPIPCEKCIMPKEDKMTETNVVETKDAEV